jgi:ubiquinone/menaquinone biosynthesis C-methylase UbiE
MDKSRVVDAISRGDTSLRKVVEIPTGHMLKNSRQALSAFQLVAREVAEMADGRPVPAAIPNLADLERRRRAESARLRKRRVPLKAFWTDYLLSRDRSIGFELMMLTSAYREFMLRQVSGLGLKPGNRILDLGSGTGGLPTYLREAGLNGDSIVVEVDFVREAMRRTRERLAPSVGIEFIEANLAIGELPIASRSVDAAIASLFLGYVEDPKRMLREMRRVLRPGGRIVISSLRRDADMSKLFVDAVEELRARWDPEVSNLSHGATFESAIRAYMNEASRLLDLEEDGRFVFWDSDELRDLLRDASFVDIECCDSFGHPPQAAIAAGTRV